MEQTAKKVKVPKKRRTVKTAEMPKKCQIDQNGRNGQNGITKMAGAAKIRIGHNNQNCKKN